MAALTFDVAPPLAAVRRRHEAVRSDVEAVGDRLTDHSLPLLVRQDEP